MKLTECAVAEIKKVLTSNNFTKQVYLRAKILSAGCSGFRYSLNLDENFIEEEDLLIEQDSVKIIMSKKDEPFLQSASVDFATEGDQVGFVFNNPLAKNGCGCSSGGCST